MNIALIDKDMFASLLKYGEIQIPQYCYSAISDDLKIEDALSLILKEGNPIEYPSQYLIVVYDVPDKADVIDIKNVKELIATNADGKKIFKSQFREDLIIKDEKYAFVFEQYLAEEFQKRRIAKGIDAFRAICGLEKVECQSEIDTIYRGIQARLTYRHHYDLSHELYNDPYVLMIAYDRHAPYLSWWAGYFCDVIETFCYHKKPEMGYHEEVIESTGIYKKIASLPPKSPTREIDNAIKDEPFVKQCNEFFTKSGGYLVPYIFYILRDRFREADVFEKNHSLVDQINKAFPEAFDTAATFIGGFFGYEKFYDDYYTSLELPFLRKAEAIVPPVAQQPAKEPTPAPDKEPITSTQVEGGDISHVSNTIFSEPKEAQIFRIAHKVISDAFRTGKVHDSMLNALNEHKGDTEFLERLNGLLMSRIQKRNEFEKLFDFGKKYPAKQVDTLMKNYKDKIQ